MQIRFGCPSIKPEVERMTAATANVFGPGSATLVGGDEVAEQYARQWVPDHLQESFCFDERVPASTRVFSRFRSRRHDMDPVPKEPASIAYSFAEFAMAEIRVAG